MMSKEESIKIVIMTAFSFYEKPIVEFDEEELKMIKKIDDCNTIEELKSVVNSNEFEKIKKVLLDKKFYEYLKKNDFNDTQIDFINNL